MILKASFSLPPLSMDRSTTTRGENERYPAGACFNLAAAVSRKYRINDSGETRLLTREKGETFIYPSISSLERGLVFLKETKEDDADRADPRTVTTDIMIARVF